MNNKQKGCSALEFIYIIAMVVMILFVLFRGIFVNDQIAKDSLKIQGYTNIEITDKSWLLVGLRGCDGSDAAKFKVRATNPLGKKIDCYICAGWPFKGATLRTD